MAHSVPNLSQIYHSVKVKVTFTVCAVALIIYYPITLGIPTENFRFPHPFINVRSLDNPPPQGHAGRGTNGQRGGTFDRGRKE